MTRINASLVRNISNDFKKALSVEKKSQEAENVRVHQENIEKQKRHLKQWGDLYLSAINGFDSYNAEDWLDEDIKYFTNIGFAINNIYKRNYQAEYFVDKVKAIEDLIDKKNIELSKIQSKIVEVSSFEPQGLNLERLERWVRKNSYHAFACDLEHWLNLEDNCHDDISIPELVELEKVVSEKLNQSKIPERAAALSSLILIINEILKSNDSSSGVNPDVEIEKLENDSKVLEKEIERLESEVDQIENDELDYKVDESIHKIDCVSWSELIIEKGASDFSGHSYQSLRWLCSKLGQEAFEDFDEDVKNAASKGLRKIELRLTDFISALYVVNENGKMRREFPSWFDFSESLKLLGYKVSERKTTSPYVTVKW